MLNTIIKDNFLPTAGHETGSETPPLRAIMPLKGSLIGKWHSNYLKERSQQYAEIHERANKARSK